MGIVQKIAKILVCLVVVITIDVEDHYTQSGAMIWGIKDIINILDKYNFKATFFVNVFEDTKEATQYIQNSGNDVQLHIHPDIQNAKKCMYEYDLGNQISLIKQGCDLLYDWIGEKPVCFRAGTYGANDNTLLACKANNIFWDSSYFLPMSKIATVDIIHQLNITNVNGIKTDIDWMADSQLIEFIETHDFTNLFMHSYSLLNWNETKTEFMTDSKDRYKFDKVLQFCYNNKIEVMTVKQFIKQKEDIMP